jgi:hypothetical protein
VRSSKKGTAARRQSPDPARQQSTSKHWFLRNRLLLMVAGVLVLMAMLISVLALLGRQPGEAVETQGNEHIESVNAEHEPYNTDPPTSGPHVDYVASWGVQREPVPDEEQVHNLEDGGVVVQYGEGVDFEEVKELARITADYERVVLAPRPSLSEDQIALTAWERILRLSSVDEGEIRGFVEAFEGIDHHSAEG